MKFRIVLIVFMGFFHMQVNAQKPVLNLEAIGNWGEVSSAGAGLSQNGRYAYYTVDENDKSILKVKAADGSWEVFLPGGRNPIIADNDQYLVYESGKDSIVFFEFKKKAIIDVQKGTQLQAAGKGRSQKLTWLQKVSEQQWDLQLWSAADRKITTYNNVRAAYFNEATATLVTVERAMPDLYSVEWITLKTGQKKTIWEGDKLPLALVLDRAGKRIAFTVSTGSAANPEFVLYTSDAVGSLEKIDKANLQFDEPYYVNDFFKCFNQDGSKLVFSISKQSDMYVKPTEDVSVDVWHYRDTLLQAQQLIELKDLHAASKLRYAFYDFLDGKIKQITKENDESIEVSKINKIDKYIIVYKGYRKPDELQIDSRDDFKRTILLKNIGDGSLKSITGPGYYKDVNISPHDKYVIYFDQIKKHFFSYNIATGITKNISSQIPSPIYNVEKEKEGGGLSVPEQLRCIWLENYRAVFIYDQYDIWQVDPSGRQAARCITEGYGKFHNMSLRFFTLSNLEFSNVYKYGDWVWIKGLDMDNYREGFTRIKIGSGTNQISIKPQPFKNDFIKQVGDLYLVKRSSNSEASNWFVSKNLQHFKKLTDLQPQKQWNWYTKELVNYQLLDGLWNKGILYKPENFDPTKKYPVIFHFYEILSDKFYELEKPRLNHGKISPAWMCSQGYIVFQPDIHFKFGNPGECAYNAVMSAAKYLTRKSWVDSTKMGLSGESHGAFSINYILTRTNIFAAAAPGYGMVDEISGYNNIRAGASRQWLCETNQERMGATLWEKPELYIANSPIFRANRITTPILIMHNKEDEQVPWSQGLEWFMALRRLGKKVWMLQYDGEGHGIQRFEKNEIDYTQRCDQFFDHYLKSKPAPIWMTQGVPAKMKMRESGLELDTSGKQP